MYRIFDKHQSSKNWVEILLDILYAFLHFLFAKMYMYHCAHQGSAKEVTPHEGRLLPTTGNSKGLQCCQGVLLNVCLSQAAFGPVSCMTGIADILCVSKCTSLSHSGALYS